MELSNNTSELVKATECVVVCYSNNRKLTQLMMIRMGILKLFLRGFSGSTACRSRRRTLKQAACGLFLETSSLSLSSLPGICKVDKDPS